MSLTMINGMSQKRGWNDCHEERGCGLSSRRDDVDGTATIDAESKGGNNT